MTVVGRMPRAKRGRNRRHTLHAIGNLQRAVEIRGTFEWSASSSLVADEIRGLGRAEESPRDAG
jgi:hypothetical protein